MIDYISRHVSTATGLPQSYFVPGTDYWHEIYLDDPLGYQGALDSTERRQERIIARYGLNLYDGATFQIAMSLSGDRDNIYTAAYQTVRLLQNQTGDGWDTRATSDTNQPETFLYGDGRAVLDETNAFYFRVISDAHDWPDPMTSDWIHWDDWKPVAGENAWCGFIGPLQTAYIQHEGLIPLNDPAITMAYGLLVAMEAMQNEIGAVYHVPTHTFGKSPNEISNENNFSIYAGLRIFRDVLEAAATPNPIRNPSFEVQGQGYNDARYWNQGDPEYHGGVWGNVSRENWHAHSGSYGATIRGTWAGSTNYGGWWQEAGTEPGRTHTVSAWFWADTNWTASSQELKVEFWSTDGSTMISAVTNAFDDVSDAWVQKSVQGTAPSGAGWVRAVVGVSGAGVDGSLQFDDVAISGSSVIDTTATVARVTNVLANMESYFENYLYNTNDKVFFTGGTYDHVGNIFEPYVFDGYWIGGPYYGSNLFTGATTNPPPDPYTYTGTNLYTGNKAVRIDVHLSSDAKRIIIAPSTTAPDRYDMDKVSGTHFRYTLINTGPGDFYSFSMVIVNPSDVDYLSEEHSWTVEINDPPAPYTSMTTNLFAVDVQTWGLAVLGAETIDGWLGEGTAYDIWQNTKVYGGYFETNEPGVVKGVGFSDINNRTNTIFSAEWTFGAILACRNLARDYYAMGLPERAKDLERDADSMRTACEGLKTSVTEAPVYDGIAYLYANTRYEIPFGWWANYIPSMASTTWAIMTDRDFDPFTLGGGEGRLIPWLEIDHATTNVVRLESRATKCGHFYKLQSCSVLDPWQWADEGSAMLAGVNPHVWTNVMPTETHTFYKVIEE